MTVVCLCCGADNVRTDVFCKVCGSTELETMEQLEEEINQKEDFSKGYTDDYY